MPRGIDSKPEVFIIRFNLLSRINGPENYEFCSDCQYIDMSNNDWFCDFFFFKFLQWTFGRIQKQGRMFDFFSLTGKCKNLPEYGESERLLFETSLYAYSIFTAFHSDYLNEVGIYTAYITSPPLNACR